MDPEGSKSVSVIIPFYRDIGELNRCLEALDQSSSRESFEVIVVEDHAPEDPSKVAWSVTRHGGRYYRQPENYGPGVGRSRGAQLAKGRTLVFLDSDCVPPMDWPKTLLEPIFDGPALSTTSCYSDPVEPTWLTIFQNEDYLYRMPSEECDTSFVNSCSLAVHREIFLRCGGFPNQRISEDFVLGMRLLEQGAPAKYLPLSGVKHGYHRRFLAYLRQRLDFASNTVKSYLVTSRWKPGKGSTAVRSFNLLRTFLGLSFAVMALVSLAVTAIAAAASGSGSTYVPLLLMAALAAVFLELLTHARFLLFLGQRRGVFNTASYGILLIAVDLTYAAGVLVGTIAGIKEFLNRGVTPLPTMELAKSCKFPEKGGH